MRSLTHSRWRGLTGCEPTATAPPLGPASPSLQWASSCQKHGPFRYWFCKPQEHSLSSFPPPPQWERHRWERQSIELQKTSTGAKVVHFPSCPSTRLGRDYSLVYLWKPSGMLPALFHKTQPHCDSCQRLAPNYQTLAPPLARASLSPSSVVSLLPS